ncbi:BTB/POZ domain-containing protein [Ditylenchus destructor]|nr:BTB/POZ domain-containing protein [Ditylenchus destructor]
MSGSNSTPDDDWVRLNVGGKIFETTKFTLSQHPGSFLARLVNGGLPSKQDKSGAFLIDRSYEHFDTILNYLRTGSANFDRSEKAMKDLLSEADFYSIQPLVDEIEKAMRTNHTEAIIMSVQYVNGMSVQANLFFSETQDDYEVLQALRDRTELEFQLIKKGHYFINPFGLEERLEIESALLGFGFVQNSDKDSYDEYKDSDDQVHTAKSWKFVRTVNK